MKNSPKTQLQAISSVLSEKGNGWKGPSVTNNKVYTARWKFFVGDVSYGTVQFVQQPYKGTILSKIAYECPYESLFDTYVDEITEVDGELVDNFNESDGGQTSVYKRKSLIIILTKYPASLKHNWIAGLPTGYFKVLMHRSLE